MRTVTVLLTVLIVGVLPLAAAEQHHGHHAAPAGELPLWLVMAQRYHEGLLKPQPMPATALVTDGVSVSAARAFTILARTNPEQYEISPLPFAVDQGDMVTITIRAANSQQHGFFLQRYNENFDAVTTQQRVISFVADTPGSFFFFCTIFCGDGHGSMGGTFIVNSVQTPAPTVTGVSPASGPTSGGTNVTVNGMNFMTGATVRFGNLASVGAATVVNPTQILATTPSQGAGSVSVIVTNPDGQSGTSTSQYTYTAPTPGPIITSFSPTSGSSSGGTNVTITGTGFVNGATVTFGSVSSVGPVTVISSTALTATSPAQTTADSVSIAVTNPDGQSALSSTQFQYTAPGPTITSVAPSSGSTAGGTNITITGNGFQTGATVMIGTAAATNVVVVNSSTITARTPLGPSDIATSAARDVRVANPGGFSGTRTGGFTYTVPQPTITSISPSVGSLAGGGTVTITGTGFTSALPTTVTFDGTAGADVQVLSAVTLSVKVPAHAPGAVNVVLQVGSNSTTANGAFRYDTVTAVPRRRSVRH